MTKLILCMKVSMTTYYKLILWFWWRWSNFQTSRKSKFAMSLQYLKKDTKDEVYFLHADKHQSSLQVDFNILVTKSSYKVMLWLLISMMNHSQSIQSNKCASLCNISKKLGMEFIFYMHTNIKISTSWYYCFWWKRPDMSKVCKAGS